VKRVLGRMNGTPHLMGLLLYGAGLRLMECCRLRFKDIDFSRNEVIARSGKGNKDRYTMLPSTVRDSLIEHLRGVKSQHDSAVRQVSTARMTFC
jgi:site-specific recombinase XerD